MKNYKRKNNQKGYAILFTVIIISTVSAIVIGISNTTYKQLILSSVAKDSHLAFFQSDMATECALYADNQLDMLIPPGNWDCGIKIDGTGNTLVMNAPATSGGVIYYSLDPLDPSTTNPCFSIEVDRVISNFNTTVRAKGYNICNASSLRKVEREINVSY
jgi:hypothetical protein